MSIKSSLVAHLRAQAGISGITSRIRLAKAEQSDALPYVVLHEIDGNHMHHMMGATGLVIGRFQIDCYESSPIKAAALAEAVRQELDGYRGPMGDVFLQMCHLESQRDDMEPPAKGAHDTSHSVTTDYLLGWTVSVPTF